MGSEQLVSPADLSHRVDSLLSTNPAFREMVQYQGCSFFDEIRQYICDTFSLSEGIRQRLELPKEKTDTIRRVGMFYKYVRRNI